MVEKCPVCDGRGFLDDIEPEDYIDQNGNTQIRFNKGKLNCPNPRCKEGLVITPDAMKSVNQ